MRRWVIAAAALALAGAAGGRALAAQTGPYDIPLTATPRAPTARGHARLHFASSPFGAAVTADGRARYDIAITLAGLPEPATLGAYTAYVAWAASPDLREWQRLGTVANGTSTLGTIDLNKFLVVIAAEPPPPGDDEAATHSGPVVLRGFSPSTWLQSFITHPLFRGVN